MKPPQKRREPHAEADDNSQQGDPGQEDESNNVEKILGVRTGKRRIMKVTPKFYICPLYVLYTSLAPSRTHLRAHIILLPPSKHL